MKHEVHKATMPCSLSRRLFLKQSAAATALLAFKPETLLSDSPPPLKQKSIVAVSQDLKAITADYKIEAKRVRSMIDEGIKALTNTPSAKEGWLKIFPQLKGNEVIGLKVNTVNSKIPAHPEVAYGIADSLVEAGIKDNNIIIWDNLERFLMAAGYTINTGEKGVRCYGTYHDKSLPFKSVAMKHGGTEHPDLSIWLDPKATVPISSQNLVRMYSAILSQHIDYLINVPVLKSAEFAGATLSLKNMYGTISLSEQALLNIFPPDMGEVVMKMHANNCNPQIAEVNAGETLMKKTKLVVLDGLMGIYEGSAHVEPQGLSHKIVISQDRVAADVTGLDIINARRKEKGIAPVTREKAGHIWSAEKLGIGNADPALIEVRPVNLNT